MSTDPTVPGATTSKAIKIAAVASALTVGTAWFMDWTTLAIIGTAAGSWTVPPALMRRKTSAFL